jgi:amino acid transporter
MTVNIETTEHERGLIRALSPWGLAAAVANMIIGGGIFILPAKMAAAVGSAAPFYYIACAVAVGAVGLCFAEAGSRVAVSGGVSGCVEAAFGRYLGFITAVMLWLGAGLAAAGIGAGVADALARVIPTFAQPLWRDSFIVVLFATLAAINVVGVRAGGGLVLATMGLKLVPLLVLVIVGGLHVNPAQLSVGAPGKADVGRAMLLGVFAFMGMETALGVSGEVRKPERNVPLGLIGALLAVTALYILIQLTAEGLLGPALAVSKTPLADAMGKVSPTLAGLLLVGGAVSMLGYLSSDILSAPRILFGMGRDGFLPAVLAKVNPRTRAPYVAIIIHVALVCILALTGAFEPLAVLSTLVVVPVYMAGCAAAVVLQRRGVAEEGKPLNQPFTPIAAAVGIVSMIWLAFQGTRQEVSAVLATLVVFSLIYALALRRRING